MRKEHLLIVAGKQAIMGREIVACDVECISVSDLFLGRNVFYKSISIVFGLFS